MSAAPVHGLRVTVESYDFFGKLLWVRTAVPVPSVLGPGDTATLSRDAGVLVHTKNFRLAAAGVANMFPHTAHVESVAVFER